MSGTDYSKLKELFERLDEPYGAGLFEMGNRPPIVKFSNALKRFLEKAALPVYDGGDLYPSGYKVSKRYALTPDFSFTFNLDEGYLYQTAPDALRLFKESGIVPERYWVDPNHAVGGNGYTHSIPNFARIASEGLDSYEKRILKISDDDLREGLLLVLSGIRSWHFRCISYLSSLLNNCEDNGFSREKLSAIINALNKVPFGPASNIYEALISENFIYYMDWCDNPGRIDADLYRFYKGEDITDLLRQYFNNINVNEGWSGAIGYNVNPVTLQCLKAIKGMRRPQIELMVRNDMPDEIWDAAEEALMSGCGNPSVYNVELYCETLKKTFKNLREEDLERLNGGGCTEIMLAGLSNVGSLDAGINSALIFYDYMPKGLLQADTYEKFRDGFISEFRETALSVFNQINVQQKHRMVNFPQPMRTLLIDDCIDSGKEYNAGGARYCFSVVNIAGSVNVYDSMIAVKNIVYDRKLISRDRFASLLEAGDPYLKSLMKDLPCFGNDNPEADSIAKDVLDRMLPVFDEMTPFLGGKFIPASIQLTTYVSAGASVGATPDGRSAGSPLCDSVGPRSGKGKEGPTAVLSSVAGLDLKRLIGTPVLNLSLQRDFIKKFFRPLITVFFSKGGMHAQISCYSKEDIKDALVHPENHSDLIVRIGGYTEYFNRLSPELRQTVYERTLYGE